MKNYKKFSVGDRVLITISHRTDLNLVGTIKEVRPSFCKIETSEGINNHTYGQFEKIDEKEIFEDQVTDYWIDYHKSEE